MVLVASLDISNPPSGSAPREMCLLSSSRYAPVYKGVNGGRIYATSEFEMHSV